MAGHSKWALPVAFLKIECNTKNSNTLILNIFI